jgi:hypothetical protein
MVAILLIWVYAFYLSVVFGFSIIRFFSFLIKDQPSQSSPLSILLLAGLALLTGLVMILSFGMKIGWLANLLLVGLSLILVLSQRRIFFSYLGDKFHSFFHFSPLTFILFLAFFGVVLIKSSQVPQNYDTGLYHAQAIHWIENYPVIPGLGNLHDRLAFDSSWLLISALFSFSFLGLQSFHVLNAFLVVVTTGYFLGKFDRLIHGEINLSNSISILMVFLIRRIFPLEFSSPGTDMPAALLVWVIFLLSMEKVENGKSRKLDPSSLLIIFFSCYVLTIKLSTFPILLLPLFFWILTKKPFQPSRIIHQVILAAFLFLPWMARNVILSGYLVYPVTELDFFTPDWKIPLDQAKSAETSIRTWARNSTNDPSILEAPLTNWLPVWYSQQDPADRQLLLGLAAGLLFFISTVAYSLCRYRYALFKTIRYLIFFVLVLFGSGYWFIEAPAMRFGYGFIGIAFTLLYAPLIYILLRHSQRIRKVLIPVLVVGLILYQAVGIMNSVRNGTLFSNLILPQDYPTAETIENRIDFEVVYTTTHGNQCWYSPFPCVPNLKEQLVLRGSSIENGFKIQP